MRAAVVLPFIVPEFKEACLLRCRLPNVLLVDNTQENRGIMRSHNIGVDFMRAIDADWLVLLSAAVRFGEPGGLDFLDALERSREHAVVNVEQLMGWHMVAFSRDTVELAGRWDENFYPYGWDDCDYAIRIHKSQPHALWSRVQNLAIEDGGPGSMGHSVKVAGVRPDNEHHIDYFTRKWGQPTGPPFSEFFDRPFDWPELTPVGWWGEDEPFTRGARWNEQAPPPGWFGCEVFEGRLLA